ncbi:hypothetical protein BDV26DRAFT_257665 [Aspergillus bertholletiae]|uniref:Uncharacterized protein n=1 Tax=Aspergillus bertholletiae TaxID=1226010 RepID=A0A5N7BER1_9EURO|nr:hypothetical protein BDV26DRAFT_257665 [Aspergillus bertholletiae]
MVMKDTCQSHGLLSLEGHRRRKIQPSGPRFPGSLTSVQPDLQLSGTFYSSGEIDTLSDDRERAVYPAVVHTTSRFQWVRNYWILLLFFFPSWFISRSQCDMWKSNGRFSVTVRPKVPVCNGSVAE